MNSGPTPPMGLARPSRDNNHCRLGKVDVMYICYKLIPSLLIEKAATLNISEVMQHPLRARCCGFGEKDRRPIDPPPVLQLFVEGEDGEPKTVSSLDISFFLVQCDLYSDDGSEERNIVLHPSVIPNTHFTMGSSSSSNSPSQFSTTQSESGRHGGALSTVISLRNPTPTRNLMGSLIANAVQLENPQKTTGIYFVFPDLSVRSEGRYTLKFMFFDLALGEPLTMSTKVQAEIYSQPFNVYSAKKFPGMTESTELSKCFARQGIKIPIRKETRFKRPSDRFYGANALNSLNDSPSKKGHAEQAKIDEKITSPDDDDEEEMSQVQHQFVEVDHQDYPEEGSSGTNKKTSPVPYKRLSISSYLTQSNEDDK